MSKESPLTLSLKLDSKVLKYFVAGIKKEAFKVNRSSSGHKTFTPISIRAFQMKTH